jgi:FkbH-like protein
MYETEANNRVESAEQIPASVIEAFGELHGKILSRTVLPWSEHCTECVWPTCYTTCDLFSPREDGRCRRFVDGMVRIDCPSSLNQYLLKIRFKQWGKLWTPGSLNLRSSKNASRLENRDYLIGSALHQLPMPETIRNAAIGKRYGWKKRMASRGSSESTVPTALILECFNPTDRIVDLSFTLRSALKGQRVPYQKLIPLHPGFQRVRIPFREIAAVVDLSFPFHVEFIPNGFENEITLYFGLMDFVQELHPPVEKSESIKCVVWDLDNTMWNGVLVEDGPENLVLKSEIHTIIEALDRRGILHSIASKNNYEEAMAILAQHGLAEFFLYPQISWAPKSEALKTIARRLNIGMDSILFVDDQEFERMQVSSSCPGVKTLDANLYGTLPERKECQVSVTAESVTRRIMYQVEQERQGVQEDFKDDYKAFLRHCQIRLTVTSLNEENLERVHELTQRTNQMNFSGNRYDRVVLRDIVRTDCLDTYVLECDDRFGRYGIVGFGIVDRREPRMTDLMFSCRIQSKRVEHAFLRSIIDKYIHLTDTDFHANYRKTPRNAPSGQVFEDLGMTTTGVSDGVTSLLFSRDGVLPDDGIIHVEMPDTHVTTSLR